MTKKQYGEALSYDMMVAEEELILHAQMLIKRALRENNVTQKTLAERLGVGQSYVSQMLGSSARNLTLRTIARVMHVLDQKAMLVLDEYEASEATIRDDEQAKEVAALPGRFAGARPSSVWGAVIALPPQTGSARRKGEAKAFAAFEPHEQEVAIAA